MVASANDLAYKSAKIPAKQSTDADASDFWLPTHLTTPFFPGSPVIGDVCVSRPLASSNVRSAATCDGAAAAKSDQRKRDKYGRAGSGAFTLVPLSHETYGRISSAAFAFLNRLADVAAGSGAASRRLFLENAMRNLSTTLCGAVARQVHAAAPLMARLAGKAVLTGLAVPSDDLTPLTGHPT